MKKLIFIPILFASLIGCGSQSKVGDKPVAQEKEDTPEAVNDALAKSFYNPTRWDS